MGFQRTSMYKTTCTMLTPLAIANLEHVFVNQAPLSQQPRISHELILLFKIWSNMMTSPNKDQWRGALMFSLISVWINGWVNNRKACDLRRYRAHCDVIVMNVTLILVWACKSWLQLYLASVRWLSLPRSKYVLSLEEYIHRRTGLSCGLDNGMSFIQQMCIIVLTTTQLVHFVKIIT